MCPPGRPVGRHSPRYLGPFFGTHALAAAPALRLSARAGAGFKRRDYRIEVLSFLDQVVDRFIDVHGIRAKFESGPAYRHANPLRLNGRCVFRRPDCGGAENNIITKTFPNP